MGSQPITSISWLPMLRVLVTVSKDGSLQAWKTRVIINPNRPSTQTNFFEPAGKPKVDPHTMDFPMIWFGSCVYAV